jgi:hypothetical protein
MSPAKRRSATPSRRRYLTKSQRNVLKAMAQNGGRAFIQLGYRYSSFAPGDVQLFAQAWHSMLHNRWVTNRGENQRGFYCWTEEGKLAYERGWYIPQIWPPTWQDPDYPPPRASAGAATSLRGAEFR